MKSFEYLMRFTVTADSPASADRQIAAITRAVHGSGATVISTAPQAKPLSMSADVVADDGRMTAARYRELGLKVPAGVK